MTGTAAGCCARGHASAPSSPASKRKTAAQNSRLKTFLPAADSGLIRARYLQPRPQGNGQRRAGNAEQPRQPTAPSRGGKSRAQPTCSTFVLLLASLVEARLRGGSRRKYKYAFHLHWSAQLEAESRLWVRTTLLLDGYSPRPDASSAPSKHWRARS